VTVKLILEVTAANCIVVCRAVPLIDTYCLEVMLLTLLSSNIYAIFFIRFSVSDTSHILPGRTLHATHHKSLWAVINFYYIYFFGSPNYTVFYLKPYVSHSD